MLRKMLIWLIVSTFLFSTSGLAQAMALTKDLMKTKSRVLTEYEMAMLIGGGKDDDDDDGDGGGGGPQANIDWWWFVLDPGHGGNKPGAVGPTGLTEKEVNLAVAKILKDKLCSHWGVWVGLTRTGDYDVSLHNRAQYALDEWADRFISIHHNSCGDPTVNGTEVLVHPRAGGVSRDMAQKVYNELVRELGLPGICVKLMYLTLYYI